MISWLRICILLFYRGWALVQWCSIIGKWLPLAGNRMCMSVFHTLPLGGSLMQSCTKTPSFFIPWLYRVVFVAAQKSFYFWCNLWFGFWRVLSICFP